MTSDAILPTGSAIPRNGSIRGFVARHRLKVFFTLACLFSWYAWLIALAGGKSTGPNPLGPFIAFFWAVWHAPLLGKEFAWNIVPAFLLSVLGTTFVQTWIFNRTRGSVFAPMLLHTTVNTVSGGLMLPLLQGSAVVALWWTYAILWLIALIRFSNPENERSDGS